MKSLIGIYICVALWISTVEPNENELKEFFQKILSTHNINTTAKYTIYAGGRKMSISDFFKVNAVVALDVNDSITKNNINEVSHLLNIVMSCEYYYIVLDMVTFLDKYADRCSTVKSKTFDNLRVRVKSFYGPRLLPSLGRLLDCYSRIVSQYKSFSGYVYEMIQTTRSTEVHIQLRIEKSRCFKNYSYSVYKVTT